MTRWQKVARVSVRGEDYAEQYAERFRGWPPRRGVHGEADFLRAGAPQAGARPGCGPRHRPVPGPAPRARLRCGRRRRGRVDAAWPAVMPRACMARGRPGCDSRPGLRPRARRGQHHPAARARHPGCPAASPGRPRRDERPAVCGFGLDDVHCPGGCPVTPLADVDDRLCRRRPRPVEAVLDLGPHPYDAVRLRLDRPPPILSLLPVLALQDMADQDLFICPRCASPVTSGDRRWHCAGASCAYADEASRWWGVCRRSWTSSTASSTRTGCARSRARPRCGGPPPRAHPSPDAPAQHHRAGQRHPDARPAPSPRAGRGSWLGGGAVGDGLERLYANSSST